MSHGRGYAMVIHDDARGHVPHQAFNKSVARSSDGEHARPTYAFVRTCVDLCDATHERRRSNPTGTQASHRLVIGQLMVRLWPLFELSDNPSVFNLLQADRESQSVLGVRSKSAGVPHRNNANANTSPRRP
jgi:hypothetical protein